MDTTTPEERQAPLRVRPTASGFMLDSLSGLNAGDNSLLLGA